MHCVVKIQRMKFIIKEKWDASYSVVIPTVGTIMYGVYCWCIKNEIIEGAIIQNSCNYEEMLDGFITFMSIILSIWGVIVPIFIGLIEKSDAIKFFVDKADMRIFVKKLKAVFGIGMITIFVTCMIFLKDILAQDLVTILILIWIWLLLNFLCNSYRFVGIIISLLVAKKNKQIIKSENLITKEQQEQINRNLPKV